MEHSMGFLQFTTKIDAQKIPHHDPRFRSKSFSPHSPGLDLAGDPACQCLTILRCYPYKNHVIQSKWNLIQVEFGISKEMVRSQNQQTGIQ